MAEPAVIQHPSQRGASPCRQSQQKRLHPCCSPPGTPDPYQRPDAVAAAAAAGRTQTHPADAQASAAAPRRGDGSSALRRPLPLPTMPQACACGCPAQPKHMRVILLIHPISPFALMGLTEAKFDDCPSLHQEVTPHLCVETAECIQKDQQPCLGTFHRGENTGSICHRPLLGRCGPFSISGGTSGGGLDSAEGCRGWWLAALHKGPDVLKHLDRVPQLVRGNALCEVRRRVERTAFVQYGAMPCVRYAGGWKGRPLFSTGQCPV